MDWIIIIIVALFSSWMTFVSGFGLGTLLLPTFALFFPIELAVAMTAAVHFLNNIFKTILMKRHIDWLIVLKFGLPALAFSALGAWILTELAGVTEMINYSVFGYMFSVTPVEITIAFLMLVFALFDLIPRLRDIHIKSKYLPIGGVLSGFFGGLSGHQGALRSTFLVKAGIPKEVYIGTGIVISLCVDVARLFVYGSSRIVTGFEENFTLLIAAVLAAFTGAVFGKLFLKKITIEFIRILIGILLILIAIGLGTGNI